MAADKNNLVSIIITNYNYDMYVGDAISSVLAQTYKNVEILVIDDGSTDKSRTIIEEYTAQDPRVTLLTQKNSGVVAARNKGMKKATGDFLLFLDGDDKLPEEYIAATLAAATRQKLDVAYTNYERFGNEKGESHFPEFDFEKMKCENFVHVSSLVRRKVIGAHLFDSRLNNLSHEDWDFFLGLAFDGARFGKVDDVKLLYRAHNYSRSLQANEESGDEYSQQAYKSVTAFLYIINKYKKLYPGQIDIYPNSEIVVWGKLSFERMRFITILRGDVEKRDTELEYKNKLIQQKDEQISDIMNSKRYKIGTMLLSPFSTAKSVLKRREK